MSRHTFASILSAAVLALTAGCSSTPTAIPANMASGGNVGSVPKLKVVQNCGPCKVQPHIPALISHYYEQRAQASGIKVDPAREATLVITRYEDRQAAARILAGAMAGKDEIVATVSHEGKSFQVDEYYRNILNTIEDAAEKVGQYAFDGMLK